MGRKRRRRQHLCWLDTLEELRVAKRIRNDTRNADSTPNESIPVAEDEGNQRISYLNSQRNETDEVSGLRNGFITRSNGNDDSFHVSLKRVDDSIHDFSERDNLDSHPARPDNSATPDLGNSTRDTQMEMDPSFEGGGARYYNRTTPRDGRTNERNETNPEGNSLNVEMVSPSEESDNNSANTTSEKSGVQRDEEMGGLVESNSGSVLPTNSELSQSCIPDFAKLQSSLTMWKSRLNLAAMIAIVGSVRFTVDHYEYSRNAILDAGSGVTWPSYSKTQRYFKNVVDSILPKSQLAFLPQKANMTTPNERHSPEAESDQERSSPVPESNQSIGRADRELDTEEVRVFLPSSWAKLDVSTSVVFDEMYPTFDSAEYNPSPLDRSEMVQNRDHITGSCDRIYVERNGTIVPARPPDEIKIEVMELVPARASRYFMESSHDSYSITGPIVISWNAGSDSLNGSKTTHSFDRAIQSADLSPSERSVLMRLSTAANPYEAMQEDTENVIPGDTCTLLRSQDSSSTLLAVLIHPYWKQEDGLPSTLLMWIERESTEEPPQENSRDLCVSGVRFSHVVRRVSLIKSAINDYGSAVTNTVKEKPFGRLADGSLYVVYRC